MGFIQATEVDSLGNITNYLLRGIEDNDFQLCLESAQSELSGLDLQHPVYLINVYMGGKDEITHFIGSKNSTMGAYPQATEVDNTGTITKYLLAAASGASFTDAIDTAQGDKNASGDLGPLYIFSVYFNGIDITVIYFRAAPKSI